MAKVRKRGNNWQIDYFDPHGKRIRKSFKKKKEAEAELGKRVSLIAENRYLDVKKEYTSTFGELVKKYKENYQHQAAYVSLKQYCIENYKEYFGEEAKLSNIKFVDVETYRNHLRNTPTVKGTVRKEASVNREMSCLRHMFNKGVEWEMIEESPFKKGKTLMLKENNERIRFLADGEIVQLLSECPKHLNRVVVCALNTGMRRGEILGLKWEQIRNGFIYLRKTKTNEARQIPINDTLETMFRQIRIEQGFKNRSEHVFTYTKSEDKLKGREPVRKRKGLAPVPEKIVEVKSAFTSAVTRAGIVDFRFHDLRHTFASQMILRGATLKDVQELLGHKTMTMTLRYAHLTQEHKRKAVNLLNGLTANSSQPPKGSCHKTVTKSNSVISSLG